MSRGEPAAGACSDAEARRLAQREFERPLLLEAGAGTGKTGVLVARLLAFVMGPGWVRAEEQLRKRGLPTGVDAAGALDADAVARETLRGVVAITFTEAAAAEMGRRVAEGLLAIRAGRTPVGLDPEVLPDAAQCDRRARALVGALDLLTARTFHAYCRRLLVAHPFEAGVHPALEVDVDGQRRAEVVREILEARLPHVLGDPPDPDWETLLAAGMGPAEIEQAAIELLGEGTLPADLRADPFAPERAGPYRQALRARLRDFLAAEGGHLRAGTRAPTQAAAAEAVAQLDAALGALDDGGDARAGLLEDLAQVRAHLEDAGHLGKLAEISRGRVSKGAAAALAGDVERLCACTADLVPLLRHARELDPQFLQAARRVLLALIDEAEPLLRGRGVESFGGLLRRARDLLARRPDVARRERERTRLLLVDEFQDTDPAQCAILTSLALGAPDGEGDPAARPSLFVVGDPKQSIYGWRNADLRAYEAFRKRLVAAGGRVLPLEVNFRSAPPILDEVTRLVAPVMRAEPGVQPAFQELVASEHTRDLPGHHGDGRAVVEHWVVAGAPEELSAGSETKRGDALRAGDRSALEARAVAHDLLALKAAGVALGDVALLFRSTGDFPVYLGALREAGIPFVVERETQHGKRREILDASALVRCVLDPHDVIAFVATLRSAAVGVPDVALAPLWHAGLPHRALALGQDDDAALEAARAAVRDAVRVLAEAGVAGPLPGWPLLLERFLESLHALRCLHRSLPTETFVEALRRASGLEAMEAARHLGSYRAANLERFFADLREALDAGSGVAAVSRHLRLAGSPEREQREGRPRALRDDAVQVMTIHAAKGLDFDHVYLLQTHKQPPGPRPARESRVHDGGGAVKLLGQSAPGSFDFEQQAERVEVSERVRLLYVALTRARQRLVVSGPPRGFGLAPPAGSQAELLGERAPDGADLAERLCAAAREAPDARVQDAAGVWWRVLLAGSVPELAPPERRRERAREAAAARVAADAERLAALGAVARQVAARPRARAASEREAFEEWRAAREEGEVEATGFASAPPAGAVPGAEVRERREVALQAGTLVHAVLESVALERLREEAPARLEALLEAGGAGWASAGSAPEEVAAEARARLARFLEGPLPERLAELSPHVVARELPVLLAADALPAQPPEAAPGRAQLSEALPGTPGAEEAPADLWRGAVDLLYRDPGSGALVVADYKTDAVSGPDLAARARAYGGQGEVYVAAVQRALGLAEPPRFELWFLHAGVVRSPGD